MTLAPDVVDAVRVGDLLEVAEREATDAMEAFRAAEASGIGDISVLECRQQFTNGRAEGLAQALSVLTHRPAAFLRLGAIHRNNTLGSRTLAAVAASPEKPEPAAVVDAGSGSFGRDNGAEGARPAGDGGARAESFPRCLP